MNNSILILFAVITQILLSRVTQGQGPQTSEEMDEELYDEYKKDVCSRVPAFSGSSDPPPAWEDNIQEGEVLELAFVNMAYGLNSDSISHLKPELGWKKTVIDFISLITKTTCTDEVISESYLNAAKNLYLYYLSKRPISATANASSPEERAEAWSEIIKALSICSNDITPIEITTQCGMATMFEMKDGGEKEIKIVEERFDQEILDGDDIGLDIIIDTVWWMFSTAYSRCYAYFYPNEDAILLFFQLFREDFLEQFLGRWRNAGVNSIHFPIIFGPNEFEVSAENVRKCATAAFQYEGLTKRQLVRPLTVLDNNNAVRNYKINING